MSNSDLVCYTNISPNRGIPRENSIDTITIHCMAGHLTIERCGELFSQESLRASSNYGVGDDGRIAMYVEEKDRSWCSSNRENDDRAVTIEVASDSDDPYAVTDEAYEATIKLVADICKRNGIEKLVWSDDANERINHLNGVNMTVHRDFDNKACPGDYLYGRMGDIANKVNAIIGGDSATSYEVKILLDEHPVREEPGKKSPIVMYVKKGEVYTIVEEQVNDKINWGKLKSGVGWISLSRVERI